MAQSTVAPFSLDADWDGHHVDGEWVAPDDREGIDVQNPATGVPPLRP